MFLRCLSVALLPFLTSSFSSADIVGSKLQSKSDDLKNHSTLKPNYRSKQYGLGGQHCMPKCGTPIGAERRGNGNDIPEWRGGIRTTPKPERTSDPVKTPEAIAKDKPLFTITKDNVQQYREWLSAGHQRLFREHKTYTMPVYPSRRAAAYPKRIYKRTRKNGRAARLESADELTGAAIGFPFPYPLDLKSGKNPAEKIMWNHRLRYRGDTVYRRNDFVYKSSSGTAHESLTTETIMFFYANIRHGSKHTKKEWHKPRLYRRMWSYLQNPVHSMRRKVSMMDEPISFATTDRQLTEYHDRAPSSVPVPTFDTPVNGSFGLLFEDQIDMFNGSLSRFHWKLLGKREMLIPYNAYQALDRTLEYEQLMGPKHFNQTVTRYEKHRVWVIEATLRKDQKHTFARRIFYLDEDCWCVAMVDNYDHEGALHRFQEGHLVQFYDAAHMSASPQLIYDFKQGSYFASALTNKGRPPLFNQEFNYYLPYGRGRCGDRIYGVWTKIHR